MQNDPFIINNIIALCHIIDEFEEFKSRLLPYLQNEFNRNFVSQLRYASQGYYNQARRFYLHNVRVIGQINKYSNIFEFIDEIWDSKEQQNPDFQRIYEYILGHKDQIDTIINILESVRKLGFYRFDFDDTIDFTKETYNCPLAFRTDFSMSYVANIKIVSSSVDSVSYKTTDSNYKIELATTKNGISTDKRKIVLNSLLFDADSLPKDCDIVSAFNYIMYLYYDYSFQKLIEQSSASKYTKCPRKLTLNKLKSRHKNR